jgi:hypothetical protein
MRVHHIKTHPEPFSAILDGDKNFEFRKNDRDYTEADLVVLLEYCPHDNEYTGRQIQARVGYVLTGPEFGVPLGYCVFSLLHVRK